jgi:predicted GH43/DUF377 family glycosyl hydrolase
MKLLISLNLTLLLFTNLVAQTNWTKYPSNPVLKTGASGAWDNVRVYAPTIILEDNVYKMWYAGFDATNFRIGYATSTDKINWAKFEFGPVLLTGPDGSWDAFYVSSPSVILKDGIYHMWYTGWPGSSYELFRIGYAISNNGTNWDKYDFNPVLSPSTIGNWDPVSVKAPSVVFNNGIFHMWFAGYDVSNTEIGYATSFDGINWNWYQGNPVLEGTPGTWENDVTNPNVIFDGITYHMWYTGIKNDTARIGYVFSSFGIDWIKDVDTNPVIDIVPETWEQIGVDAPEILIEGETLDMWYSGFSNMNNSQIGYAYSKPVNVESKTAPSVEFNLQQNYPNPFNPATSIKFAILTSPLNPSPYQGDGHRERLVTLKVYDMLGNEIATLVNEELPSGEYVVNFDVEKYGDASLPSGIYFYKLIVGNYSQTKKLVLLK